ncbi:ZIP family metal transporter [Thermovenabulum gondwanense]|uniref:Zinc transporter ZupT n=1 Tax=Thermovenabulum gondwanense TaxID=520767 RepID=A0A162MJD0_9FIRM|nr:ZIP family metal transporter [Thermovenabulum gondwanense]KYO66352.1 Zinc transporter ZupT [Thermovenabulum gondwanense]
MLLNGILGSAAAGLITTLGAFFVFFKKEYNKNLERIFIGFAAGIMLAASIFSLLLPSIEKSNVYLSSLGFLKGAFAVYILDKIIVKYYFKKENKEDVEINKIALFILAIVIHNFPEGLAVGIAFYQDTFSAALALALGIAIQNIPEGSAVAFSLIKLNYSRVKIVMVTTLTGLAEPVGAMIGLIFRNIPLYLPFMMAFAAGSMVYVIISELIPEFFRDEKDRKIGSIAVVIGFIIMMLMDSINF